MAGGSASSFGSFIPVVLQPTTEKLGKNNHTTWRVQVLATLRGARLDGYVTDKKKTSATELEEKQGDQKVMVANPEYEDWLASNQQVFNFILASVSKEILARIATATTVAQAWEKLEEQFTSQTRACAITTRMTLAMSCKGSLSVTTYLAKMQGLANAMVAARKALDDEDLVQYILSGLDDDYDSVVNSVLARPIPITVSELAAQMISSEARVDLRSNGGSGSVNFTKCGRGSFGRGPGDRGCDREGRSPAQGRGDQNMRQVSGGHGSSNGNHPQCQVCRRYGHTADRC
jgi:hypothetical protein